MFVHVCMCVCTCVSVRACVRVKGNVAQNVFPRHPSFTVELFC